MRTERENGFLGDSLRIAVLVKQVPDSRDVRMDETTGTILRSPSDAVTNPLDLYALSAALRLKREVPETTITAFSMGPESAKRSLREALALGADDAILIQDRRFAGSDTLATALILSATLEKFGPFDLVLTGERATDGETGQVGPEIAARLGIPPVTFVESLTRRPDRSFEAKRKTEVAMETIRFAPPALVAVTKGIGDPGLPTLNGKIAARRRTIPTETADNLPLPPNSIGLAGSPTRVVKIFHSVFTRHGEKFTISDEASLSEGVAKMVAFLRKEGEA